MLSPFSLDRADFRGLRHPSDYFPLSRAPASWFNIYTMLCVNCHGGIPCSFSSPLGSEVLTDKMITSG